MSIYIKLIAFTMLCLSVGTGYGQTPQAFERAADAAFEAHDYYSAFNYYGKVIEMEPQRVDMSVRYADAARLYGAYRNAETHYENALKMDAAAGGLYTKAILGLAMVKKHLGKYEEALKLFERYAARPDSDPKLRQVADTEIADCEWAMEKITNPDIHLRVVPMSAAYNTGDSEMGTLRRGDSLYFCGLHNIEWGDKHIPARPVMQVMLSVKGGKAVPAVFNAPKQHTALPAISADGRIMVIPYGDYAGETAIRCTLYFVQKDEATGKWSQPVPLPSSINVENYTATQPQIIARKDGYYDLYYVSDAPGGRGGKDLWRVQFSASGNFAQPENLRVLNTEEDEATPFFDLASNSLYFSSLGYQNIGGYDVYRAALRPTGWQKVQHLPVPLNSSYNDLYYAPQSDELAYMTSNRIGASVEGEESCCYDLFSVEILPIALQALAFTEATKDPLDEVVFSLLNAEMAPRTKFSAKENKANFDVKRDKAYTILASKEGYYPDTVLLVVNPEPNTKLLTEKLYLRPMQIDLAVRVFNDLSKEPLTGVNVRLYERSGRDRGSRNTGDQTNESALPVDYKLGYIIIAEKEGFAPDTTEVSAAEMAKPGVKVIKNLFLTPASMYGLLPLAIYFDNDVPPRQSATKIESYDLTVSEYMARREDFILLFTQNMVDEAQKNESIARLNAFFDKEVAGGYTKLEYFADNLDLFLDNGYEVEIMVKGFASPLASKEYNLALTKRRIVSVQNYLRKCNNGYYESFIQTKKLIVTTAPYGETLAKAEVADNARDKSASVFSVEASRERRAEIIEVKLHRTKL